MDGIIVLHEFHPMESNAAPLVFFILLVIVSIATIISLCNFKRNDTKYTMCGVGIVMILLFVCFIYLTYNNHNSKEIYYKVYCDETVNMKDFNEKYEVIEQEGLIYIVKERENTK